MYTQYSVCILPVRPDVVVAAAEPLLVWPRDTLSGRTSPIRIYICMYSVM